MTDEELAKLMEKVSGEIGTLPADPEKLSKDERRLKLVLRAKADTLNRIKEAKEKGSLYQEVRANMDYSLLEQYGYKHPLLMYFLRGKLRWYGL